MNERRIHQVFELSVLLKGAHAAIECIGGAALAVVPPGTIAALVNTWTQDELVEDPKDYIAAHLLAWAQGVSIATQHFYAFYLLSHGVVKLALVIGLLRGRLWSYPASLAAMALFIAYQLYRFSYTRSPGLIALTVFDLVMVWLIWHEWRVVRRHLSGTGLKAR
ncbi:MAG TPA: DUF2127 domain-containing protein [Dongiaceae bacterium]|jgi:uncharacterized membrane protein|nr:DUF2127 domain-containing protein [Dongiaceae bacterium]